MSSKVVQRQKAYKPRSKTGCLNCKKRHLKCDENPPSCHRCVKAGLVCQSAHQAGRPAYASLRLHQPASKLTPFEGQTIHLFEKRILPLVGVYSDQDFWLNYVLPASQSHNALLNALLAATLFIEDPHITESLDTGITGAGPNIKALQCYQKSINLSAAVDRGTKKPTISSITLSLFSIIAYIHIEARQLDSSNQNRLIRMVFSMIHSAQSMLSISKDPVTLKLLKIILDLSANWSIDSTRIPKSHRESVLLLTFNLCLTLNAPQSQFLHCEMIKILWDVDEKINLPLSSDALELENRLQSWSTRLRTYESTSETPHAQRIDAMRMRALFLPTQVQWQVYCHGISFNRHLIENLLAGILSVLEVGLDSMASMNAPTWFLDAAAVPMSIFVAWYWRNIIAMPRITNLLHRCRKHIGPNKDLSRHKVIQNVLEYVDKLLKSENGTATKKEYELFGRRPKVLQLRHAYELSNSFLK